ATTTTSPLFVNVTEIDIENTPD
ncbi:unnamed protein product, partial [Rotaria sordida]